MSALSQKTDKRELVLLCNPQAGGRWKELAGILDSQEARHVRRIVTDSIADVGPALANLGDDTKLVCIYGGDGTIHRIINRLFSSEKAWCPPLAFIGGGTMNLAAGWCGLTSSPEKNFRQVCQMYQSGELLFKEIPLLRIQQGDRVRWGFIFGTGPIIRIVNEYEQSGKGKAAALVLAAEAVLSIWTNIPKRLNPMTRELKGEVTIDGKKLPYDQYTAVFCSITSRINPIVEPFIKPRTRDTFHCAAYASNRREFSFLMPFIARGMLPIDPKALLRPASTWKKIAMSYLGKGSFPTDPRYVNDVASEFEVHTDEEFFTIDGEILPSTGEPIKVSLGPRIKLAVSPTVELGPTMRLAAKVPRPHRPSRHLEVVS